METYSIDFYCLIGPAIGYLWKYIKKERSRDIRIWTLAASVKIKFLESLFPQRSDNRINSSSTGQRMVGRIWFGIWYGRIGLFWIHIRQAPIRIANSGFKDCEWNHEDNFQQISRERSISWRRPNTKTNVHHSRRSKSCFKYFLFFQHH